MAGSGIPQRWLDVLGEREAHVLASYQRRRDHEPDLARAALLVVDAVESFVGPRAPVEQAQQVARQACGDAAWRALPQIRQVLDVFRANDAPVVFTVVAPDRANLGGATPGHREADSGALRGDVVVGDVAPTPSELVLAKTRSSAFFGTPLVSALVRAGVQTVVVAGGTTSGCVLATAIDAASNGFDVLVVADACFDRVAALHEASLVTLDAKWARVTDARSLAAALPAP